MAYYYAAHFNTPFHQTPAPLALHHPLGISPNALPITPAKSQRQDSVLSLTERRILFADHKINEQESSLFFQLPAELRNQIYEELLCPDTPTIKDLAQPGFHASTPQATYAVILSTCRKIHEEATDLLYTTHIFHAHPSLLSSLPHLESSAKPVLYPNMIAKIKRWQLTLRLDTDPRFTAQQAAVAFSGAEYLEIRVWQSMFHGADCSVLKLFLGVRGVKIARLTGSVEPELARWMQGRMMSKVVEEEEGDGMCRCGNESGVVRCGDCNGKMGQDLGEAKKWFGGRDAWVFGNR